MAGRGLETRSANVSTPHLDDLFAPDELAGMQAGGYVKTQTHPEHHYRIYNYTQRAQFDRVWNTVTKTCRGLIVNPQGEIIARPFEKFFNLVDHSHDALPGGRVVVTDKLDGSLGILYPTPEGHSIATRGSFTSEQARHATRLWQERYHGEFEPNPDWTYLFEIIYPANRIVVDYQDLDDLVLLGAVETRTGKSVPIAETGQHWPGPRAEQLPYRDLEEALAAPVRDGREGVVLHFLETDLRVKVKYEEYVRLHRIVTGVSERRIWEALSNDQDIEAWLEAVPDEFYDFVAETRGRLLEEHARLAQEARQRQTELLASLGENWQRKDYAAKVTSMNWPLAKTLFLLLDGRSIDGAIWDHLRPAEHLPLFSRNEDNS